MPTLRPLEFRDCVVDGPSFRRSLRMHEEELKARSKQVKDVYNNAERVFKAMAQLHQCMRDFATSLSYCSVGNQHSTTNDDASSELSFGGLNKTDSSEITETEDEVTIRTAFSEIAKMIHSLEDARETMLEPIKSTVLTEINELRTVWLAGHKMDSKSFLKETNSFCQKLEKYLSLKQKENTAEIDEQMLSERHKFISQAFDYLTTIHEVEELTKSKFVQTISLFIQVLGNFYHQAFEHFLDSQHKMSVINIAAQRSSENFQQICDETKVLKEKLLNTHWEQIQSFDSSTIREGYLFLPIRKAVATIWVKHFCVYDRKARTLKVTSYTQGRAMDSCTEYYTIKSCTRRPSENVDRRFCFDVETENKTTPLTLQAQSLEDLQEWLLIMDAKEPPYADRSIIVKDPERTILNARGYEFLCNLLKTIEAADLRTPGLYRISGVRSKISFLVSQATSLSLEFPWNTLNDYDIHTLTGAVKHFVRHLDEPLMTFGLHDQFLSAIKNDPSNRLPELIRLLSLLPTDNWNALKLLITHLSRVAAESDYNGMTSSNLGIVFAPSLLRSSEESVAAIMNTKFSCIAIQLMIENYAALFCSTDSKPAQPPKPPNTTQPLCAPPLLHQIRPNSGSLLVSRNTSSSTTEFIGVGSIRCGRDVVQPVLISKVQSILPVDIPGTASQSKQLSRQLQTHDSIRTSNAENTQAPNCPSNYFPVSSCVQRESVLPMRRSRSKSLEDVPLEIQRTISHNTFSVADT